MKNIKKLFIIDGSSYIYRAYFGLPMLNNSKGLPTNAVYGFLKMIKNTLNIYRPEYAIIAMDSKTPTFRKIRYPEYKANREATPEELKTQIPYIEKLIEALNLPKIRVDGVEADDIIATLTKKAVKEGFEVVIISGDKDLMQLVGEKTLMIDTLKNKTYGIEAVIEKLGVKPELVRDYLAITGDASDNIPGVRGIGPKGASSLLNEYGDLEQIYKKIDSIKNKKHQTALLKYKEEASLSKELVTLKEDIELDLKVSESALKEPDKEKLIQLLSDLEFTSELKELLVTKKNVDINSDIKVNVLDQKYVEHEGVLLGHDLLHNCDLNTLSKYNKIFDTRIASYVLNPGERDYPLEDISLKTIKESFDPKLFPAIKDVLNEQIKEKDLERVLYEIDIPCIRPLKEMEETGVMVDVDKLKDLSSEFGTLISEYTQKIYKEAGMEFNINSPKQLSFVLFEKLNLVSLMAKKTDTGLSTDQEVLQELSNNHPLPKLIIEYRELAKLKGTYVDPLIEMAQNNDGRIRTTYNLDLTSTGRLSSSNPNLQNIPIRTPSGARIRETFIAPKGKKLISADYSQVELRIFAYLSNDEKMLDAFKKGDDIHTRTASEIFDVPIELVTLSQRAQAKAVNFGIIYGKTPYGLARELNIPQSVASKIISRYFERYSGVANVREELIKKARTNGYSETIFGRRRYLPDINTKHVARRNFAERNAINAPIQGSAADIMKLALSKVWEKLKSTCPDSKIIMHVHDELVVEAPEKDVTKVAELLRHEMEHVVDFSPRLTVQTSVGQNWLEAH